MDLELTTSMPVASQFRSSSYTRCLGANPSDILIDEPLARVDRWSDEEQDRGHNSRHQPQDVVVPLFVLYDAPDVPFYKSGLPNGIGMSVMDAVHANTTAKKQKFQVGDQVYVKLSSSSSSSLERWVGPGEITSMNRKINSANGALLYNVYLEAGEKMENIPKHQLKYSNNTCSGDGGGDEVESMSFSQSRPRKNRNVIRKQQKEHGFDGFDSYSSREEEEGDYDVHDDDFEIEEDVPNI